jgi:hypothetical protein
MGGALLAPNRLMDTSRPTRGADGACARDARLLCYAVTYDTPGSGVGAAEPGASALVVGILLRRPTPGMRRMAGLPHRQGLGRL